MDKLLARLAKGKDPNQQDYKEKSYITTATTEIKKSWEATMNNSAKKLHNLKEIEIFLETYNLIMTDSGSSRISN